MDGVVHYRKGDLVQTVKTDKDGRAIFTNLILGKYIVKETKTIDGYILDTKEYKIELTEKDNKTEIVSELLKLNNELEKGILEFTKVDLSTGEPLPNTLIEIYTENDELIFSGRTNENGKIIIKNLKYGKYYIIEKDAPEGYILNEEKMYFEIKENGEIIKANMTNEKITSTVKIHKVDDKGNSLQGVIIGIYDLDGNLIYQGTTDENGYIEYELEYGSYYFQEIKGLDGYEPNLEKVYFDITSDGEFIQKTLVNEVIVEVPNTNKNSLPIIPIVAILNLVAVGLIIYGKKKEK